MSMPIVLKMPASAINVLPIRLFVSGLAARSGFDIELIDDVKTVVSESCVMLLSEVSDGILSIEADISDGLHFHAYIDDAVYGQNEESISFEIPKLLIETLAGHVEIAEIDGRILSVAADFRSGE